jgi:hypothetical protein
MAAVTVDRADVIAFRFRRHQLDRPEGSAGPLDVDLLDLGVQDTGTPGSSWALALRGARPAEADDRVLAWTLRGAPHAYRRRDLAAVTVASAPFSEADAASRVFDASKPLRAAGIRVLDALRTVADQLRDIVREPMAKGDVSGELTARLDAPYLRSCRPCNATHVYELPFRLAALQAGLELEAGTSPPVLQPVPGFRPAPYARLGSEADDRFAVIRSYLRFFGPAPRRAIATFLDAPLADVTANLPDDVVEVRINGIDPADGGQRKETRFALAGDLDLLAGAADRRDGATVRLVGSHDPYLQLRDRDVLVPDTSRHKQLWPTLGRPGVVLVGGEVAGTWRPRASGRRLAVRIDPWSPMDDATRKALQTEGERLAAHRGLTLTSIAPA